MTTGKAAVFLDRDGTINIEKNYLYRAEDFELLPGVGEAIAMLNRAGYLVVVVSNQSGVGRGYYSEADVRLLHQHLDQVLSPYGATIAAYYFCPHHPDHAEGEYLQDCTCRKPLPGMILQAATDLNLDLSVSFMVGDKLVDAEAGRAAGCTSILVKTGYGAREAAEAPRDVPICDNLLAAAEFIAKRKPMH